ncbi:MAG: glycosyltransferase family 4 protein [Acetobacteraceae bacterium]|nr:glycosyltransferase family 4 protein [Acetobacteraceae bacterium]
MHLAFALPPPAETGGGGGADYISGLADGLRCLGVRVDILTGNAPVFPSAAIPIVDGMLLPRLQDRLEELVRADAVALIHHIAAASGRDDVARARTLSVERAMLMRLRRVVATSAPVAERLHAEFAVSASAVPPGMRDAALASPDPKAPLILSAGVLTRRKGHDRLLQTVSRLLDLPWHLVIAGDSQREPAYVSELLQQVHDLALAARVTVLADPPPEALEHQWRHATVFALASRWEGYPTAVAEAMQRGIPALVTAGANADGLLPPEAGAITPPDDMATFGKCLRRVLFDGDLRHDMAEAARAAGQALPRWIDRARQFLDLLESKP